MTPTNKLRFVRRHIDCDNGPDKKRGRLLSILQQWWEQPGLAVRAGNIFETVGEWRDVPVEDE